MCVIRNIGVVRGATTPTIEQGCVMRFMVFGRMELKDRMFLEVSELEDDFFK